MSDGAGCEPGILAPTSALCTSHSSTDIGQYSSASAPLPLPGQAPLGSHTGDTWPTSPQLCTRPLMSTHTQAFPSAWLAFSHPSYSSFRACPWTQLPAQTGPRVWAVFWLYEHVLAGYVTAGRDAAMCHQSGSRMLPPRGPESPQRPGALCVLSTAAVPAPGAVPNVQPPPARQCGDSGQGTTWRNYCSNEGPTFSWGKHTTAIQGQSEGCGENNCERKSI